MTLTYKFVSEGGYDCMTDAFFINDTKGKLVATIDLGDFGQHCYVPPTAATLATAKRWAKKLTERFNRWEGK